MRESERPQLTPTQWRVLVHLASGESNAMIATALGVGLHTVTKHVTAIYRHLPQVDQGSKRAAAAIWYATVGRTYHSGSASIDEEQRRTRRTGWRRNELDQVDRALRQAGESFALVSTFLADSPEAAVLRAEAVILADRTKALRANYAQLTD